MPKIDNLLERIADNPSLPTPPAVALNVLEKASRPDCTLPEIAAIIQYDPAICGKILRLINSALFSVNQPITSLTRALHLLGLNRVKMLVLGLSLPGLADRILPPPQMQQFWKTVVTNGIVAQELAQRTGAADPEIELVAGLLCDIGTLVLQELFPAEYSTWIHEVSPEVLAFKQCELEEMAFGHDHAQVSTFLLKRWHLPDEIVEAVRCHHYPDRASPEHPEVMNRAYHLFLAQRIAQLQVVPDPCLLREEIFGVARGRYELDPGQLAAFLTPLAEKIRQYAALLEIPIGALKDLPLHLGNAKENLARLAVETSLENLRIQEEKNHAELGLLRQAQKMETMGRLAGGVAHDFNNLLTIIDGYSQVLLTTLPAADPSRDLIQEIKNASDRATDLTRQLLAFSRNQSFAAVPLDLNQIVSGMEKMLGRIIGEDIELCTRLAPGLHAVNADPGQLEQVIMNLTVNARDAMARGGKLLIETANVFLDEHDCRSNPESRPGHHVMLAVTDSGAGMDAETRTRLFEPFFTTKDNGKGTGLGLSTVQAIVKQSNGQIKVQSEPGKGTAFRIYFPRCNEQPAPAPAPVPLPAPAGRGTETVLLAEDEDGVRKIARQVLEMNGYHVLEACNGREALHVSEQHPGPIHLLLTDAIMPHMGGCELANKLLQKRGGIKVLYTSGYTDDAIVRHGVLSAGAPFLHKPYSPQTLVYKVRELLN